MFRAFRPWRFVFLVALIVGGFWFLTTHLSSRPVVGSTGTGWSPLAFFGGSHAWGAKSVHFAVAESSWRG